MAKIIRTDTIQIGDKTHHQDQSITLVNFKTINTIVNNVAPLLELVSFVAILVYLIRVIRQVSQHYQKQPYYFKCVGVLDKGGFSAMHIQSLSGN